MSMLLSRKPLLAAGALFLAALFWGLAPVATRYLLALFSPLQLVLVRFLLAALFLLPLLSAVRGHRWRLHEFGRIIFCGLVGVIGYNLTVAYGLRVVPSGIGGLLIATEPIWILLISALVLREKISWSVVAGLLLSLAGIGLLLGQDVAGTNWNGAFFSGALLIVLAALMWSIYTVAVRSLSKEFGARTSTALTMVIGTLPLLAFWDNRTVPLVLQLRFSAWAALALLVVGSTVIAMILWNYGVAHTASAQAGLYLYLVPLISIAGGALFLHEQVSVMTLLSGLLIIAGVALAQMARLPGILRRASKEQMVRER